MKIVADLHTHSRFSRACSKELTLPNIARWCEKKGIGIVGTGDFTHPAWLSEIKKELTPAAGGLFGMRSSDTLFMLTTEVACIYKQGDAVRRIHLLIMVPTIAAVERIVKTLEDQGRNLKSDGRPILGLSSKELLKIVLDADPRSLVIPAHAWTPWFAIFGSESGFDSIEECFGSDLVKHIHAIETGLSSDPAMNWRLSALDNVFLLSNSDAHSLPNLGREANVFDMEMRSFDEFARTLRERDRAKFLYTIEFFPEEGKYHFDGHRLCGVRLKPSETRKYNGLCPSCKKPLTVGVLARVEELADRPEGFRPEGAVPFKSLVPLQEVIAEAFDQGKSAKRTQELYEKLTQDVGSEFSILLDLPYGEIGRVAPPEVVEAIRRVREGKLTINPGFDGQYGTIKIFTPAERKKAQTLFPS